WDGGAAVWGATGATGWGPSRRLGSPHPSDPGRLAPATPRPRRRPRSLGELRPGRPVRVARVQAAELQAAQGPGGPEVAHDPEHVAPPRVHQSQRAGTVSDCRAEILLIDQESCSSMR